MPNLQEEFFQDITKEKNSKLKGINTYRNLIFNAQRYFISSGFPLYTKQTKSEDLDFYIKKHIANSKPLPPLPMYMMKDFISFIEINKLDTRRFALDILKFELTQIDIFNLPNELRANKFSWNKRYKLGINAKLIKSTYPIHSDNPLIKKQTYLLLYKELDYESYFIEITKFLYELLSMKNNKSILNNLKFMSKKHNLDYKETKNIIQNTLSSYANKGILATIIY